MTIAQFVQEQTASSATYERMLQKGMLVACFLFRLRYQVSTVYFLTSTRDFNTEAGMWTDDDEIAWYRFLAYA